MTTLIEKLMHLTDTNVKKIAQAVNNSLSVTIQFMNKHLSGSHPMMLLKGQLGKVEKALKSGTGVRLTFSPTQLKKMSKHGGFLAALLPFLAETVLPALTSTVLPALATGALGGLATFGTNKILNKIDSGSGLSNFGQVSSGGCAAPKLIGGNVKMKTNNKKKNNLGKGIYSFGTLPRK